ncbi:ribosome maturation factor RimM [Oceanicoccus sagamiensis]|uniref:Ribosome maturation factor RimM n=1 Tax=Oceanicoccus sagamiensis TaxID=716816 RepID=A0A1X9NG60_9GAMM|nr:ribosome maturation factor RimM [Oceanicoccus sagamiensis]ARN75392.1 ribosome maturation factor RimM [Oceanicoccus sagamiensis]
MTEASELVVIGKITSVYGIKGWVKIHSYTQPMENLMGYKSCYLDQGDQWEPIDFEAAKRHGKGLIALIDGVNDREQARGYCQRDIAIPVSEMPVLTQGDFYWHQLDGLKVFTTNEEGDEQLLGEVKQMMETGANDVLVVKKCQGSIDKRERLIPWIPDQVIKTVDIEAGLMRVDWDAEF